MHELVGGRGGIEPIQNTQVELNKNFDFENVENLSATGIIVHEVGFHNMTGKEHRADKDGNAIYPKWRTLESNADKNIIPSSSDTKQIINNNLMQNRLDIGN